jgi:hypothetical protein
MWMWCFEGSSLNKYDISCDQSKGFLSLDSLILSRLASYGSASRRLGLYNCNADAGIESSWLVQLRPTSWATWSSIDRSPYLTHWSASISWFYTSQVWCSARYISHDNSNHSPQCRFTLNEKHNEYNTYIYKCSNHFKPNNVFLSSLK